jgi:hypothetical protein
MQPKFIKEKYFGIKIYKIIHKLLIIKNHNQFNSKINNKIKNKINYSII